MKAINKFPEKYIKKGKFKLHSGGTSNILYDVNTMLTNYNEWIKIREAIPKWYPNYVGIATGGAIIASQLNTSKYWLMIKDGELKGKFNNYREDYCLIDDVVTTESSIKEAIKIIGKKPKHIFVVMDRRKKKTLVIQSLYQE